MIQLVAAILMVLAPLLQWLLNRKSLTPRQVALGNHLIAKFEPIKARLVEMGCKPKGELSDAVVQDEHAASEE